MDEKIRSAFDSVHAEEALKDRTREFVAQKMGAYQKKPARTYRRLILAAACLLFALLCGGGWYLYFTPVASISVDVNPSIELGINRFDRVVSVEGYNEDGRALADSLHVWLLPYEEALDQILSGEGMAQYMTPRQFVSVTVVGESEEKSGEMLEHVSSCASHHENVHCSSGSAEEVSAAHEAGLSFGKYRAFLELQALDPTVTPEDVRGLTMRQIRDRIAALSGGGEAAGEESSVPAEHHDEPAFSRAADPIGESGQPMENCQGQGSGNGTGNGQGHHHGKRAE